MGDQGRITKRQAPMVPTSSGKEQGRTFPDRPVVVNRAGRFRQPFPPDRGVFPILPAMDTVQIDLVVAIALRDGLSERQRE